MNCLNCENSTSQNFCPNCGQKTDTHRITFQNFITHDILHGVWHFERGIFYTIKEAIFRPGKAALDYISGKRIKYYNVFYLILLFIGLNIFLNQYYDKLNHYYFNLSNIPQTNTAGKSIDDFVSKYSKLIIFSFVPLLAFNSWVIFRRKRLNLSEHFIISGMIFLGVMIITTIGSLTNFTEFLNYIDVFSNFIDKSIPIFIIIHLFISYYNCFKDNYNTKGIIFRTFLNLMLFLVELIGLIFLLFGYFTNWSFNLKLAY